MRLLLLFTLIVALVCLLPTHEAATATRLKSLRRVQRIYQESNYCHQEVIGSSASLEQLNSEIDAYATAFATHFGLTGDYHQYINFATVPDRTEFDSCAGPYSTVVDVFFKFPASTSDFAQYDAYIQSNPLSGLASAQCASVSVVANLPGCSAPSTPTGANPTQPPEVTEAPTTPAPATEAPTSTPTGANPTQAPDTDTNWCHQQVLGSSASLEQLNTELDVYATAFATHFGLTGDYHQYVGWARVPDRTSFDACAGPYSTVVDVFFKFPASTSDFAQYEAYLQSNPLSGLASVQCASVSVVANLPGCSAMGNPTSTPTGTNPTQPPEVTEAPTTAAPTTEAPTEAPTSTPTGANPTQGPDTDTNWCHQQVLGSSASLEQLNTELDAYATAFASHFGLTGDYHQYVGWARVPDRTSFDACAGPYSTVVDVFFKFPASTSSFAQYEAYLQANPLSGLASVQCASVSVVANLPGCSAMGNPTSTPTGANPTQPPEVTEAPTTAAPTTEAPTEAPTSTPTGANPTQAPDTDTNWCHQQVLGSSASLEQLNSELDVYATAFATHFGLTGDYHQYVGWARVPDRTSFDACAGPYSTVVDVFFKFPASTSNFAEYEAYLQSNPLSGLASVQCASISVVANLPGCSAMGNPTSTPTGANPTQPPEVTEAPTTAAPATQAPATEAPTEAPSTPTGANPTQAPAPSGTCQAIDFTYDLTGGVISFTPASGASALNFVDVHVHYAGGQLNYRLSVSPSASPDAPAYEVTLPQGLTGITNYWFTYQTSDNVACDTDSYPVTGGAATTQPTPEAPTEAPTTAPAVTQAPPSSSPANVVCYQEIVGSSSSSYAVVSAALTAWEQKMYQSLGLTGPIDQSVGHAQVPDRNSFENGCNGPYQTVADLFVYIQATDATYQQISQQLEAFIAANPIVGSHPSISCGARSVTTFLPRCGAASGGGNPTTAPNPTQPPEVTEAPTTAAPATEAPTEAPTSTPTGANPTQPAEVTEAPTQAATEAPTQAATEAPTQAPATAAPTTPTGTNPTQPPADECPSYEDGTYVCKNGVCTKVSVTVIGTTSCYTTEASCPAPAA